MEDPEYREIQRAAKSRHMSLAEWVRQALESARREEPLGSISRKLQAIHAATQYEFPTGDIDQMLEEIEAGHRTGSRS